MTQVHIVFGLLAVLIENSEQVKTYAKTEKSLLNAREHLADVIKMNADGLYIHTRSLQYERQDKGYYGREITGQRRKRSVLGIIAQKGLKAWKLLLKGTNQVPSGKHNVREFEKIGTLKTALKDFKDADPDYVQKLEFPSGITGRAGYIGDRTIILKARGSNGKPNIEILKTHRTGNEIDPLIDRITYTNKFTY